jgi:hypothetical protein
LVCDEQLRADSITEGILFSRKTENCSAAGFALIFNFQFPPPFSPILPDWNVISRRKGFFLFFLYSFHFDAFPAEFLIRETKNPLVFNYYSPNTMPLRISVDFRHCPPEVSQVRFAEENRSHQGGQRKPL